ncbi:MAG: EAL domain-containing protein [Alcaligenaceae bacterium]|nr:EAL domain-containing protein [Alcaligenaceae bacterium]
MADAQPLVLIIDDAMPIRVLLRAGLAKAGYRTVEATDGRQGLEQFIAHKPDLVLMDVNMPVMDGFQCCRALREHDAGHLTPVIMLTGSDDLESINHAFDAGASDFIAKPINLPLLTQRIRYALRDAERELTLRRVQQQHDSARMLAGLVYWTYDIKNNSVRWTNHTPQLLPWLTPLPASQEEFVQCVMPADRKRFTDAISGAIQNNVTLDLEVRCTDTAGNEHIVRIVGQRDADNTHLQGALQDLTRQRSLELQANYLNYHDVVTGLPNRKLLLSTLKERLGSAAPQTPQAIVVLEIQRFQAIGNAYGEEVSETLLRLVGNELRRLTGDAALCARLDGAQFAILLAVDTELSPDTLKQSIENRLQALDRAWTIEGKDIFLRFTGGISLVPAFSQLEPLTLLRMAMSAQANAQTGNAAITLDLYKDGLDTSLRKRLRLETDLRRAVENEEFHLVYQPQLDLATQKIVGVEALLRWSPPDRGFVSPAEFVPVLEDIGLITVLGEWILGEACRQQAQWAAQGMVLRMGINLSPMQFQQVNLPLLVESLARNTGAQPGSIELEITESMAMGDPQSTIHQLNQLRDAGFKIAIDDFGIGFSSLEYLLRFPLNTLKIDRAFVNDLARGRRDRAIIRALTSLCFGLGLTTIAEGVETERQRDYLDALGVNEIQGYLLGRPMLPDVLQAFALQHDAVHTQQGGSP